MFERYTEKARRVIFFARYEASQTASRAIEPEHILLGLLREDKTLARAFIADEERFSRALRNELTILAGGADPLPASVDMPLSPRARQALTIASEEGLRLRFPYIGTELLLLGVINTAGIADRDALMGRRITAEKIVAYLQEKERLGVADEPAGNTAKVRAEGEEAGRQVRGKVGGQAGQIRGGVVGYRSFEEFFADMANKAGVRELQESFRLLLEILVQNGTITRDEKDRIEHR